MHARYAKLLITKWNSRNPLHGKSVEPRNVEMTARSSESISNAVNLQESLRVKAFQARARGNYALAISQYTKLLEIAPRDPVVLFQLAVAYEKTGDLHRAFTTYEKVVSLDEDNYFAYYNVGNILMRKNKVSEAIQSYTRAIEKCDPRSKQYLVFHRQRGAAYRKRGDFEHASHDYAFYHSRSGHQVKQDDCPWDCQPVTDAENDEGGCERLRSDRGLSGTGHYSLSGRVVYNSDSLYAVSESSDSDKSEIPYQTWSHHRVFEIERLRGSSRSREDLLFVMDTLRKVFPFCASLREEAAALLCAKLVATENICAGTPLFFEKAHGTHVFFICRGCVAAHKTAVQRIAQVNSSEQVEMCADNNQGTEFAHSWESLKSEMAQNESDDEAFPEAVIHKLVPITPKWKKQQMQLCQLGAGNVIGFQGRYANNPR
uniref:Uncharacterized protein n=1 Tax=Globisporangium ultimum (strain ATCC 200006 / CBS 805.95 / DAOM BR144) TaxID=431595 RepID=K3WCL1_GLOUD